MESIIVIFVVLFALLYGIFYHRFQYWKRKGVPYPTPTFLVGNVGKSLVMKYGFGHLLKDMYNKYSDCAYVGFYKTSQPCLLIRDPEIIKNILIKDFYKFQDNYLRTDESVDPILGRNAFVIRGEKWKKARLQVSSQLTSAKVKQMAPLTEKICTNMVDYLQIHEKNGVDIKSLAIKFTVDNVASCSFGLEGKSFTNEESDLLKFSNMLSILGAYTAFKQTLALHFPNFSNYIGIPFLGDKIPRFFYDIVEAVIKYRNENNITRNDFFDAMRNIKADDYTIDNIVANIFTIYLDGTETSSIVISYALYELAVNAEIQNRVRDEAVTVLQKHDGKFTFEALQEMEYLQNVLLETVRKYPVILTIARLCTEDYELPPAKAGGKNVIINRGTPVFMSAAGLHWNTQYYPNPEKFDPDRFAEGNAYLIPKCCFLGFGEGPRICVGKTFALFQIKAAVASIITTFEVQVNQKCPVPLKPDILQMTLNNPSVPINLNFFQREK